MEAARERPQAEEVSWGQSQGDGEMVMPSCRDDKLSYRRLRLLGQGSFGKAFLARDLANNELCVMKQVRVEKMDAKARDTAVREAVALRRVRHPNVVRFRQVFVRSGWLCLVMDYADGGDLCAAVKERARSKVPFEENAVLECFAQVADAVSFVHSQKMVHRDIKSRNVFLCRTGRALLGDFGLVRLLESTCELAHTRVGTPYYLSPEIIRKQPYNYKTDVWSLGVLLYEMSALTRPFVGTLETLPKAILKGSYEPLGKHYSKGLHDLCAGMLKVDPEERLDLAQALQGEVLSAPLQRSRDALGLEPPEVPEEKSKRSDRLRREVQEGAEQMKSEWMGYNTMVKRSNGPILPVPTAQPADAGTAAPEDPTAEEATKGQTGGPHSWSTAPQRDPDSGDEDLDDCSSDSWGSVVDTGVEAVAKATCVKPKD
mmetsp:Transcript_86868/g.202216  ORF Transcript_86868/g.202216 Transcript_86868/m.202216 type:complete len:429 (+) Transcript_86868:58-1344(+)